jgi:putative DNA primase/helicase
VTRQRKPRPGTFLDAEGHKLKRLFLGLTGGAAIMLDGFDAVLGGLHICEGCETGLAGRQLGLRPCWALGSAGAIAGFPVLGGVETFTILAEHDEASARAVESAAARWHSAGRQVLINRPIAGKDLKDSLRGAA